MSDLLKRFENLTINSSDDERNILQGYVCKVKSEKSTSIVGTISLLFRIKLVLNLFSVKENTSKVKVMLFVTAVATNKSYVWETEIIQTKKFD